MGWILKAELSNLVSIKVQIYSSTALKLLSETIASCAVGWSTPCVPGVSDEVTPGGVPLQCGGIAQHPQSEASPGDGHIQAPLVSQESDRTSLVGPHSTEDDDIHFPALGYTAEVMMYFLRTVYTDYSKSLEYCLRWWVPAYYWLRPHCTRSKILAIVAVALQRQCTMRSHQPHMQIISAHAVYYISKTKWG